MDLHLQHTEHQQGDAYKIQQLAPYQPDFSWLSNDVASDVDSLEASAPFEESDVDSLEASAAFEECKHYFIMLDMYCLSTVHVHYVICACCFSSLPGHLRAL